jgi:hypothetical protein
MSLLSKFSSLIQVETQLTSKSSLIFQFYNSKSELLTETKIPPLLSASPQALSSPKENNFTYTLPLSSGWGFTNV